MDRLLTSIVFFVTLVPAIVIGILLAPLGLADDWAKGYENWLVDTVCNCRQAVEQEVENE